MDINFLKDDIILSGIKMIHIIYVSLSQFVLGFFGAILIDTVSIKLFGKDIKTKNRFVILGEILFQLILTGIIGYLCNKVSAGIPFPLDGIYGFNHYDELNSSGILTTCLYLFQQSLGKKINYFRTVFE